MTRQTLYKLLFWTGYTAMFIAAFLPAGGNLSGRKLGSLIRLDYLLHFLVYLAICLYFLIGQKRDMALFTKKPLVQFILVMFFLAMITEVVQIWVPGRSFNPFDWVANVGGLVVGVAMISLLGEDPRKRNFSQKEFLADIAD